MIEVQVHPFAVPETRTVRPPRLRHYTPMMWEPAQVAQVQQEAKAVEEVKEEKRTMCVIL